MSNIEFKYVPATFDELGAWEADDHLAAYEAFQRSCAAVLKRHALDGASSMVPPALVTACSMAQAAGALSRSEAKTFFESVFTPHRVEHSGPRGMLTGYYEPVLEGSREARGDFTVPVYRRPPELVNIVEEAQRGAVGSSFTHMRKTAAGMEPFFTREEIENGALEHRDLELVWLKDPVETFMLHVQGSGRIRFPDGTMVRITYDGKNGYPYTSVGRYLTDTGQFPADAMSLEAMKDWLKADSGRGRRALHQNKSFIFFRELFGAEAESAMGVMDIPLTPDRSLAVDTAFHEIGVPVWVYAPEIRHATKSGGFHRLMVAQDVGSAIKGPERGDLYFGSGDEAGRLAGITKHPGNFFVLLPNEAILAEDADVGKYVRQARQ